MERPLISVITCTYNSEAYLQRALDSVKMQTYQNIEHIINDSFSSEETLAIIQAYIAENAGRYKIRFIQSEPKGVANALNVATRVATGEIVHYLHSDDYYPRQNALEEVAEYFSRDPALVWLTGNFLVEYHNHKFVIPQTLLLKKNPARALSVMNFISHENTFMKREFVPLYGGFEEDRKYVVEYGLWLKLIRDYQPIVVNDAFTVFTIHKGSTSTGSVWQFSKAVMRAFKTQHREKIFPLIGYYEEHRFAGPLTRLFRKLLGLRFLPQLK